jgi:hypothetical protein
MLLRIGRFLDFPVPAAIVDQVAVALGVDQPEPVRKRLSALGVLEQRSRDRLALNGLAALRIESVSDDERDTLTGLVLDAMRPQPLEEDPGLATQAFLLAAPVGDLDILTRTAEHAIPLLPNLDDPKRTTPMAIRACRHLIDSGRSITPWVIMHAVDQGSTSDEAVDDLLSAARKVIETADPHTTASLLLREGRALARRGEPDEALDRLTQAESQFRILGDARSRAVTGSRQFLQSWGIQHEVDFSTWSRL